mmetsp:Transcript_39293/g.86374  ORF Transcript_39293/g.86374 Transcript_39293/m.86374 type:complete len:104 (-) Transcript_39293:372-683(-)
MAKKKHAHGKGKKKASDQESEGMEVNNDRAAYTYSGGMSDAASSAGAKVRIHPKKRMAKLSRKQKIRKSLKAERGEALLDRAATKKAITMKKLDRVLRAKALW